MTQKTSAPIRAEIQRERAGPEPAFALLEAALGEIGAVCAECGKQPLETVSEFIKRIAAPFQPAPDALREALEPFAALLDTESNGYESSHDDEVVRSVGTIGRDYAYITVGDLRRAKTALSAPVPSGEGTGERVGQTLTSPEGK